MEVPVAGWRPRHGGGLGAGSRYGMEHERAAGACVAPLAGCSIEWSPLVVPDRGGCWTERWDRAWCLSLSVGCTRSVFSLMVWHGVIRWSAKGHGART